MMLFFWKVKQTEFVTELQPQMLILLTCAWLYLSLEIKRIQLNIKMPCQNTIDEHLIAIPLPNFSFSLYSGN